MTTRHHRIALLLLAALAVPRATPATDSARPLVSVLSPPAQAHRNDWRPAQAEVELPHGDPFSAPLEFTTAERRLFADAADARLDEHSLLEAALLACGVDDPVALSRYREKFSAAFLELRSVLGLIVPSPSVGSLELAVAREGRGEGETLRRIELVHRLLHQRLLFGGYDTNATNLAGTLDTGVYNCASATLLFVALCNEVGIPAEAVELPGHVRCIVVSGAEHFEIEVTCPHWPQALRQVPSSNSVEHSEPVGGEPTSLRLPGYPLGAAFRLPDTARRHVSPLGLLAMIYYNRGVDAFEQRRFAEATSANRRALLLDPNNQTARGNLLAAVNNWALALCDAGRFAEAESLLTAGQRFDPDHLPFAHNANHVRRMWNQSQSNARIIPATTQSAASADD